MGRRRDGDEIAFGSDSFLDIVANIVGILIILIVIAGVRVSQMPVSSEEMKLPQDDLAEVSPAPPSDLPSLDELPSESPPVDLPPQHDTVTASAVEVIEPPVTPEPPSPSPELVRSVEVREWEIRELERRHDQLATDRDTLGSEQAEVEHRLSTARNALDEKRAAVSRARLVLADQEESLEFLRGELATLQLTLADAEAAKPEPTVLKHKLTPVGREVAGDELHFLLSEERVAVVPFDELAEELKSHFVRKKNHILRTQRYVGSIGPVRGFRMDFVLERQPVSIIEELRMGAAMIRAGLTYWQIHPQPGVIAETAAQALHPQSRFLAALRRADPDSTLTCWVYPDSFGLHRELQEFVHRQGFEVAARPLPAGVPISGSPQGSRSVAQ